MPTIEKPTLLRAILSWGKVFMTALIIAFLLREFVVVNAQVVTGSMEPTIMAGDRVIFLRTAYLFHDPERFDVIAFDFFEDGESLIYVKRVIGLPGEQVEIINGQVFIDGEYNDFAHGSQIGNYGPFLIPDGHFFVLGDNRNHSSDSRNWPNPFLPREQILGRAAFSHFPRLAVIERSS